MIFDPELGVGEAARRALPRIGKLAPFDVRLERHAQIGDRFVEDRAELVDGRLDGLSFQHSGPVWSAEPRRASGSGTSAIRRAEPMVDDFGDAAGGAAVAIGECAQRHRSLRKGIGKQPPSLGDDRLGRGADEAHVARDHPLRPLGLLAQDEERHAERRRFLLHSARIAEDQVRVAHPLDQLDMAAGLDQRNSGNPAQKRAHRAAHPRIGMEDDLDLRRLIACELRQGGSNAWRPWPQLSRRWQVTRILRGTAFAGPCARASSVQPQARRRCRCCR